MTIMTIYLFRVLRPASEKQIELFFWKRESQWVSYVKHILAFIRTTWMRKRKCRPICHLFFVWLCFAWLCWIIELFTGWVAGWLAGLQRRLWRRRCLHVYDIRRWRGMERQEEAGKSKGEAGKGKGEAGRDGRAAEAVIYDDSVGQTTTSRDSLSTPIQSIFHGSVRVKQTSGWKRTRSKNRPISPPWS